MIKLKIPDLMKERHMSASTLMRQTGVAYATALRLAKGQAEGISFATLERLCILFNVKVQDILEYIPDQSIKGESER